MTSIDFCDISTNATDAFITRWEGNKGGAERANYALFLSELCDVLGVARPDPAEAASEHNNYVFERAVTFHEAGNRTGYGRIDLYKKGCFILEAKQSRQKGGRKEILGQQDELFETSSRGRRGAERSWDVLMMNARKQAEDYARALPTTHEWPPFILICDVGHVIEIYADFTGKGRNYTQFPDRQGFRIFLEDLRKPEIRERLKLIWTNPHELDPNRKAAKATREIAKRLAEVSKLLEKRNFDPEVVSTFLMRCLFTMFAEDVKLLPESSFTNLLKQCIDKPESFPQMVGQLWEAMNTGSFAYAISEKVRKFNGEFFKSTMALPLNKEEIGELYQAAKADWRSVEPAIFGTLLEQALDSKERKKLGAHYTPRAYVERLVVPTIIEPLREDWRNVLTTAERLKAENSTKEAIETIRDFHRTLRNTRVLDPACGTGNFLYVAMEMMKRLEGEVLEALVDLGGQEALALEREMIDPHQFLGVEVNPRGASIAELVLWLGYLQWHYRNNGQHPGEPILRAFHNIICHDALLTWDGYPVSVIKEGKETFPQAKKFEWPDAEFIVGNPPFIGGKDIRSRLGDSYTETLWDVYKEMNDSADFVMYWWDRAADLLTRKSTALRRFGFVTTNSITQPFQRKSVERHLKAKKPVSILMAIPDHPWTKATADAAAVRIAMTVVSKGKVEGILREVTYENGLETDEPKIETKERIGHIHPDLSVGPDVTSAMALKANDGLCSAGVKLHGDGFIVTPDHARLLGLGKREGLEAHIREFCNGRDLMARSRNVMVIDLYGLSQEDVRQKFPEIYQHIIQEVKEKKDEDGKIIGRDANNRQTYRDNWWIFGEPRIELRAAQENISRYIATVETTKHRVFQFLNKSLMPDNALWAISLQDAFYLGVLSSRINLVWTLACGGMLEDRPKFTKTTCFDPFPFPDCESQLRDTIGNVAEELDATRKKILKEHPDLTLTGLYNILEKIKKAEILDSDDEDIRDRGLILILKELHDKIDSLVFEAYQWPITLTDEQILERLVILNHERAQEESRGQVRWLRPEYQLQKFGVQHKKHEQVEAEFLEEVEAIQKPLFPAKEVERTAAVFSTLLSLQNDTIDATTIAGKFKQGKKIEKQVKSTLVSLARMGYVSTQDDGKTFFLHK